MNHYYQSHDVLVLSSHSEGLGMVILEAFSFSMPVVGSNVEGIAELLQGGRGLLFEPDNPTDLAQKLKWLARQREEQIILGKAGYDYVTANHNIEDYVKSLMSLYNSCK